MSNTKKRTFMLKSINTQQIVDSIKAEYGLTLTSNLTKKEESSFTKTTKISDIITTVEQENSISFLDENKKHLKCTASMVEFSSKKTLPENTHVYCFWDKHPFQSRPLGCPIKFVNSMLEKSYTSHITKDKYYMKENITKNKLEYIMQETKDQNSHIDIQPVENNYYLTYGIFCSFNCVLAFIKENNHDLFYRESFCLLHSLYEDLTGEKVKKMTPSPHWRLLKNFGGPMTIEEYRKSFNMVDYEFMFNLRDIKSISKIYKEKM